uniref:Uncharacterized protein n=1 Tax=Anguilla anguilla TaxID=7936 RepID=A0A0E9P760_ANGAN
MVVILPTTIPCTIIESLCHHLPNKESKTCSNPHNVSFK